MAATQSRPFFTRGWLEVQSIFLKWIEGLSTVALAFSQPRRILELMRRSLPPRISAPGPAARSQRRGAAGHRRRRCRENAPHRAPGESRRLQCPARRQSRQGGSENKPLRRPDIGPSPVVSGQDGWGEKSRFPAARCGVRSCGIASTRFLTVLRNRFGRGPVLVLSSLVAC